MIIENLKFIQVAQAFTFPTINSGQDIGQFIGSLYIIAISLVGVAVFVQFLRAGLIYLFAAANAAEQGKAREIMQGAVLGAILLLSATLILKTINPDLTRVDLFNLDKIGEALPHDWGGYNSGYEQDCLIHPDTCHGPPPPSASANPPGKQLPPN